MALEEIERLKERLDKDPNSKLFIPLAEEYKKRGMLDEAIETLIIGLEKHPTYMSARVSLGKIYFDKGMLDKASEEFEKVASTIPDNLYAHKKLAEIYSTLGIREKAIEEFKKVLKLNPSDLDAEKNLSILENRNLVQPETTGISDVTITGEELYEVTEPPEELGEVSSDEETAGIKLEEHVPEITESTPEEVSEESDVAIYELSETLENEIYTESEIDLEVADSYISQGNYMEAMNTYKKLLSAEPDNVHVLQRIEELKTLLELLGKDKEDLIAKMNGLLDGIKKKRDEFFRTFR